MIYTIFPSLLLLSIHEKGYNAEKCCVVSYTPLTPHNPNRIKVSGSWCVARKYWFPAKIQLENHVPHCQYLSSSNPGVLTSF